MDLGALLLFFHIVAAGIWLGTNVMQGFVPVQLMGHSESAAAAWYRSARGIGPKLYAPVTLVVLITGIWMVIDNPAYSFGALFVTIGFVNVILGTVLGFAVFTPGAKRAADAIEAGDADGVKAAIAKLRAWGVFDTLVLLATFAAMIGRWM